MRIFVSTLFEDSLDEPHRNAETEAEDEPSDEEFKRTEQAERRDKHDDLLVSARPRASEVKVRDEIGYPAYHPDDDDRCEDERDNHRVIAAIVPASTSQSRFPEMPGTFDGPL